MQESSAGPGIHMHVIRPKATSVATAAEPKAPTNLLKHQAQSNVTTCTECHNVKSHIHTMISSYMHNRHEKIKM